MVLQRWHDTRDVFMGIFRLAGENTYFLGGTMEIGLLIAIMATNVGILAVLVAIYEKIEK